MNRLALNRYFIKGTLSGNNQSTTSNNHKNRLTAERMPCHVC
ncbi:hypothetical protein HMPREF0454_02790 [Hafnia alvei ATCC 51873]|uniref:Uncharacterized protein n=1 Tax=Hafnia alvei ATCC 51873 TaxID=1002364 RepID=G9Y880_HAFAL|nr:hypothetical protein HMPREF0454_02790 [Hafnia alvei ATCC 51873]